jgi:hypothetical protein
MVTERLIWLAWIVTIVALAFSFIAVVWTLIHSHRENKREDHVDPEE